MLFIARGLAGPPEERLCLHIIWRPKISEQKATLLHWPNLEN